MWAIAAVAVVSALAQLYNSEKARGAAKDQLNKIEDMFNKIKPPDSPLTVDSPPELIEKMPPSPNFDFSKITPEEFKVIGQIAPEQAPFIAEQAPHLVEKSAEAEEGRSAQMSALRRLMDISAQTNDPALQAQMAQAERQSQAGAQSRSQDILMDAARRGQSGSGLTLAAQLGAASQGQDRAAQLSQQAAAEAYRNRLAALQSGATLGGQITESELGQSQNNASIINAFNQRTSTRLQDLMNQNVAGRNAAQEKNLATGQDIANKNVSTRNDAAVSERDKLNELINKKYGIDVNRWSDTNKVTQQNWDNQRTVFNDKNNAQQKVFDNAGALAAAKAGVGYQRAELGNQAAQAQNQAIQGLGQGVTSGMIYNQSQQGHADDRNFQTQQSQAERDWYAEQREKDRQAKYGHTYK